MAIGPWLTLFDMATKKPETFKRSAQIPDAQLGNTFSGGEDSYGNKAADMVASNSEKSQSAAEELKKTADAAAQPGLLDTILEWVKSPSDVSVNTGDARNLFKKEEPDLSTASGQEDAINAAAKQVGDEIDDKASKAKQLPSWVSDAASVYSRLAEQNAARDADLRSERRDSAAQAMQMVNAIPGISDAWARNNARTRGLTSIAGR